MYCNMTTVLKMEKMEFSVTETVYELEVPSELPRQNSAELYISKTEMGKRAVHISLSSVGK